MRNLAWVFALVSLVLIVHACENAKRAKNFNEKTLVDRDALQFINTANDAGLTEVKASALAESMSKNPRIIRFAKMIMEDHTQMGVELSDIAKDKLIDLPDTLTLKHQKSIDSLAHLTQGFDGAYMHMMVNDHMAAVNLFETGITIKNAEVQKFAKKTLSVLKMHLDSAKAVRAAVR